MHRYFPFFSLIDLKNRNHRLCATNGKGNSSSFHEELLKLLVSAVKCWLYLCLQKKNLGINFPATMQTLKFFGALLPPLSGMAIISAKHAVGLFFTLKITQEGHQLNYSSHMELSRSRLVVKVQILMGVFSGSLFYDFDI